MGKCENELTKQLPEYFRPILEFQEIMKAQGYMMDQLVADISRVYANNYISTCDEPTISYYENLFGIVYRHGDTLEFRRSRVLQKFNTITPFSVGFLKNKLGELFGNDYELSVTPETLEISIKVTSDRYGAVDLLYNLLWDVVPAHLKIVANQQTTNYSTSRLSAAGFAAGTYIQFIK